MNNDELKQKNSCRLQNTDDGGKKKEMTGFKRK